MATEEQLLKKILDQLERMAGDVSIIQGDLNAIRNGEYDPPAGAAAKHTRSPGPTAAQGEDQNTERW